MFLYRVKYTESESDIKNNDLLYKIDQTHQNPFEMLENVGNFQKKMKNTSFYFVICIICFTLYFVNFVIWGIWGFLYSYKKKRYIVVAHVAHVVHIVHTVHGATHTCSRAGVHPPRASRESSCGRCSFQKALRKAFWNSLRACIQNIYKNIQNYQIYKNCKIWIMEFIHNTK